MDHRFLTTTKLIYPGCTLYTAINRIIKNIQQQVTASARVRHYCSYLRAVYRPVYSSTTAVIRRLPYIHALLLIALSYTHTRSFKVCRDRGTKSFIPPPCARYYYPIIVSQCKTVRGIPTQAA